jgi:hypothetical protein
MSLRPFTYRYILNETENDWQRENGRKVEKGRYILTVWVVKERERRKGEKEK